MLHGDLLPQNLLWNLLGDGGISLIDWECARIGDPLTTWRLSPAARAKPLQESGGFQRLLATYNSASETNLPDDAVHIHELLMHLRWLAETAQAQRSAA
jgi:aminoglycoside phosphotransferase (APT) family kinase protein